ncbi:MAG: diaminopimelate decarboxylase [Myxococcota bacterium]
MHDFKFIDDFLYCEKLKVAEICKEVETPFYLYSRNTIEEHFKKLDSAFGDIQRLICFSVKSNSNLEIIKILKDLGAGADIVSGGELYRARKAGIPANKIVYSGVGKTDEELEYALKEGILMFNVESEEELDVLDELAGRLGKKAGVALRVNPDVDPHTHEKITTGKEENKFGVSIKRAKDVYQKISREKKNLRILGIDCHIGSQILSAAPYIKTIELIKKLLDELRKENIGIKYVNIGGGLGIIYENENPQTAAEFRAAIDHLIGDLDATLVMEPGRFIVGNAGILVTKVLFTKQSDLKRFVIVDSGMNDLIRPTLYDAFHFIQPVAPASPRKRKVDVVGPVCESGDFFAKERELPDVKRGDILAVMSAGAYGFSMASNYNTRKKAAEIIVEGDKFRLIRKRESYDDIIKHELF